VIVRPAQAKDLAYVAKILTECEIADGQDMTEFTGILLVAERGGEVIGFAQAIPAKPIAFFALLAVLPAHRKTRAALKLVEGVELLLRASGCIAWSAFVDESNETWKKTVETWGGQPSFPGVLLRKVL